jgi:hypothetical protein
VLYFFRSFLDFRRWLWFFFFYAGKYWKPGSFFLAFWRLFRYYIGGGGSLGESEGAAGF